MADDALIEALAQARRLLRPPEPEREPVWPTLAAAAFFAFTALTFAAVSILAPPVQSQVPAASATLRGAD